MNKQESKFDKIFNEAFNKYQKGRDKMKFEFENEVMLDTLNKLKEAMDVPLKEADKAFTKILKQIEDQSMRINALLEENEKLKCKNKELIKLNDELYTQLKQSPNKDKPVDGVVIDYHFLSKLINFFTTNAYFAESRIFADKLIDLGKEAQSSDNKSQSENNEVKKSDVNEKQKTDKIYRPNFKQYMKDKDNHIVEKFGDKKADKGKPNRDKKYDPFKLSINLNGKEIDPEDIFTILDDIINHRM